MEIAQQIWGLTMRSWVERKGVGFCQPGEREWGARVFTGSRFIGECKTQELEFKACIKRGGKKKDLIWNQPRCLKQRRFWTVSKPVPLWSCSAGSVFSWDSRLWSECLFSGDVLAVRAYGIAMPFLWLKLGSTSKIDEFTYHCSSLWDSEGLLVIAWIINEMWTDMNQCIHVIY